MPIDQSQQQKINKWLQSKFPIGLRCPLCSGNKWTIGDISIANQFDPNGGVSIGGGVPVVLLVCNNCMHVPSFAAVPMGLAPQGSPP